MHEPRSLWIRVALPFGLFVVAGSLGLMGVLHRTYQRQSSAAFKQLADANAEFVRAIHLPLNDRFAEYLSRVLGVTVAFRPTAATPLPVPPGCEEVTATIEPGIDLVLQREQPAWLLVRPLSLVVLGSFWVLSVALAWALTQSVVRPYLETQRRLVAAERLATLGRMASALAHEIQNPVAAIRLHAQLLEAAAPAELSATVAATVPTVLNEAARIESLVNQWMFLARPEPPQTSALDLAEVLAEVVNSLQPLADHARVRIVATLPDGAVAVRADRRRLAQVFGNLLINAIQAMPAGGTVRVTAASDQRRVRIVVTDTGPGFSPAALARCPEMFYSEREGGMGIGLSVAHEIVRAHGGVLTIGNEPAGGARVTVELPAGEVDR